MTDNPDHHLRALFTECPDWFHPACSFEDFQARCEAKLASLTPEQRELVAAWLEIGHRNPWICQAYDPPFTVLSFYFCQGVHELVEQLLHGNWCLGQAFALGEVCFINQVNGGGEWLTIKGHTAFESITAPLPGKPPAAAKERLSATVERIQRATEEQCRELRY